jgi:hypothetical protein
VADELHTKLERASLALCTSSPENFAMGSTMERQIDKPTPVP